MNCTVCGYERVRSARYCTHCGHPFGSPCRNCDFENPPGSRFCGGCRLRLPDGDAGENSIERRPITFLFCDLVDSTRLFERLDPEDVREVQNALRGLFGHLATAHDGYVAEYLGDGVVVYFGYPQAQEDDPERAIRCALAMGSQVESVHAALGL
jgi:class 3 adenylate cyclase